MAPRDPNTLDIFLDWTPPEVVTRYDETRVRTASLRARISRAVSETLKDCEKDREEIAQAMSAWLGEDVPKSMLDAYASEARSDTHTIPYLRLLALVHATGDLRLLQLGAEMFGFVVAHSRYLEWIKVGMEADRREQAQRITEETEREFELALRAARKGARP
jgi:hypothetical protein